MATYTGVCTSCGDVWEEDDDKPSVCPECGFTGVVGMPSDNPAAIAMRKRHEEMREG